MNIKRGDLEYIQSCLELGQYDLAEEKLAELLGQPFSLDSPPRVS